MQVNNFYYRKKDVGHGSKNIQLHKHWSRRIIEEFYLQGEKELDKKIPLSSFCDRNTPIG